MTDISPHLRRFDAAELITERDNDLVLRSLLATTDSTADLSMTWVQLDGHHRRLRTDVSTRIYVALEGSGTLTLDQDPVPMGAGDVVIVPPGTPYHLDGKLTYLVLNQPGFTEGDDLYLEDPQDEARDATS